MSNFVSKPQKGVDENGALNRKMENIGSSNYEQKVSELLDLLNI